MSENNFRAAIRSAVRGLWTGDLSDSQFDEIMRTAIEREFWKAFEEGIDSCGYTLLDLEDDEKQIVKDEIANNEQYIDQFSFDIQTEQLYGGSLEKMFSRAEMWIVRYKEIVAIGRVTVCGDTKLEWRLGETEEHCESCEKLDGIVKRASFWDEHDVHPQGAENEKLMCGGWRCACTLEPTSKPITKGPLPNLP